MAIIIFQDDYFILMTFEQKYCDADFLDALDTEKPQVATYIAERVGCGRSTVLRKMAELEAKGLVKCVDIEGGFKSWIKIPSQETIFEGVIGSGGIIKIDDKFEGMKYKLVLYEPHRLFGDC